MAEDAGLGVARKPDSQDICFVPFGDYRAFLKGRVPSVPGSIVNQEGELVGRHQGIESFTVGQRRGLGIGNREPCYVLRLEPETNRVVVGPEDALYQARMWTSRVNYTLGQAPGGPVEVGVKIRYKSEEARAVLRLRPDGALVCFEQPQRAITPGQAAVFYRGDVLLGGGTIERDIPPSCLSESFGGVYPERSRRTQDRLREEPGGRQTSPGEIPSPLEAGSE
jgi:tRNA-specific 2-thiouridylase